MTLSEFEHELKLINKDLSIRPNNPPERVVNMFPDVVNLAAIVLRGNEICTIPNNNIYDEPNGSYGVDLRNDGRFVRHRTRQEALEIVKTTLARIESDKEFEQQFFGTGEYSDTALRSKDDNKGNITLVEEVPIELKEVKSGMIEGGKNE